MIDYIYEKSVIGYLIGYYRKLDNRKLYIFLENKKEFYNKYCLSCNKCKDSEIICVPNTLYKIEKGNALDNDCYYFRLAENLNKKYELNSKLIFMINDFRDKTYKSIMEFNEEVMLSYLSDIKKAFGKYKNVIYIKEILQIYIYAISVLLNCDIPDNETISVLYFLKDYTMLEDRKLILLILYYLTYRKDVDFYTRLEMLNEISVYYDDPLFLKIYLSSLVNDDYVKSQEVINNYLLNHFSSLTNYQKYIIYDASSLLYLNLDALEKAHEMMKECVGIAESSKFPSITLNSCFKKMAIISFMFENYDEVILYLSRSLSNSKSSLGINYSLLFYSLEKHNQTETIKNYLCKIDTSNIQNSNERKIIEYYKKKYNSEDMTKIKVRELEKYICDELTPIIINGGSIYEKIFRDEMRKHVTFSSNYKNYYIFEQLIH